MPLDDESSIGGDATRFPLATLVTRSVPANLLAQRLQDLCDSQSISLPAALLSIFQKQGVEVRKDTFQHLGGGGTVAEFCQDRGGFPGNVGVLLQLKSLDL